MQRSTRWAVPPAALVLGAGPLVAVTGEGAAARDPATEAATMDLSGYLATAPGAAPSLLFVHHSTGSR